MIKETLYAEYLKERAGHDVLENENGFIVYGINTDECFIVDMFIKPNLRGLGQGKSLLNNLENIARDKGCKFISANIHLQDKNASKTLLSALHSGFRVEKAGHDILLILLKFTEEK